MAHIIPITDANDPRLDVFARLTEAQLRNKLEPEKGGLHCRKPQSHCPGPGRRLHAPGPADGGAPAGGPPPGSFFPAANRPRSTQAPGTCWLPSWAMPSPGGCYAPFAGRPCLRWRTYAPAPRRVAVLEGIVDTTNVGAIFRSAAALHVDGVLLSPTCCDPFNRRAVRVSMGTVFQVPWTYLENPGQPLAPGRAGSPPRPGFPHRGHGPQRPGPVHRRPPAAHLGEAGHPPGHRGGRSGPCHHRPL